MDQIIKATKIPFSGFYSISPPTKENHEALTLMDGLNKLCITEGKKKKRWSRKVKEDNNLFSTTTTRGTSGVQYLIQIHSLMYITAHILQRKVLFEHKKHSTHKQKAAISLLSINELQNNFQKLNWTPTYDRKCIILCSCKPHYFVTNISTKTTFGYFSPFQV